MIIYASRNCGTSCTYVHVMEIYEKKKKFVVPKINKYLNKRRIIFNEIIILFLFICHFIGLLCITGRWLWIILCDWVSYIPDLRCLINFFLLLLRRYTNKSSKEKKKKTNFNTFILYLSIWLIISNKDVKKSYYFMVNLPQHFG